jgi:hypothetical protein
VAHPQLDEIQIAGPPEAWQALGFTVEDGVAVVGGVRIRLGVTGDGGIVALLLRGLGDGHDLDGLALRPSAAPPASTAARHPVGASAVDHVVALTPDFDATVAKLRDAGLDYRATREAGGGMRQAFFVLGPCLLELGGPADGPARLWGLTLVVDDLDAAAELLGDRLGAVKDAVQPGRRIATVRREAGLGVPVALMTARRASG